MHQGFVDEMLRGARHLLELINDVLDLGSVEEGRLGLELQAVSLDPLVCPCATMFRIDEPHLAWCLESLVAGEVVNRIEVDAHTTEWARVALERMLAIV